ncbi:sensor histidine kinase [Xanthocytophaga flava]|uniref:sensor histidine kinase n=1 Tax=Xanthocytophaga flava TaxID=3048013 RepID=UPI0028D323DB|nr:CHASE3 domain-containing protein [Xanthocytophaga flavus]MDJ1472878.1 CHASE3 domain-containing protein [Xanthocytophaga flavus]
MIAFSNTFRIILIITLSVVLGIGVLAYFRFQSYREQTNWVIHTHHVIETGERMFSCLKDIQLGQRGYLLGGDTYFLTPYHQAMDSLPAKLEELASLTRDNIIQQQRIEKLQSVIKPMLADIEHSVNDRRAGNTQNLKQYLDSGLSKPKMDEVRVYVASILEEERELLAERMQRQQKERRYSEWVIYAVIGCFIVYMLLTFWQIRRQLIEKYRASQEMHRLNHELGAANEELAAANEEMAAANEEMVALNEELTSTNEQLIINSNTLLATNQELNQLKNELQDRVAERTRVLEQTLNELKERNHELDNYVYKVSHDLRAPLASILGLLQLVDMEMLNKDPSTSQIKNYMELIQNRVHKADQFVQSVLMHSKSLNLTIQPKAINFAELIRESYSELQYMKNASAIDLQIEITEDAVFQSDELFVGAVIKNFLSNAIKYQDTAKSHTYVQFVVQTNAREAVLHIEDNGIGIEDQYQKQIFDMFFRATAQSDGSGLGLYIVRQIVTRLGGTLRMESRWGKGTLFTITLPNLQQSLTLKTELEHVE